MSRVLNFSGHRATVQVFTGRIQLMRFWYSLVYKYVKYL